MLRHLILFLIILNLYQYAQALPTEGDERFCFIDTSKGAVPVFKNENTDKVVTKIKNNLIVNCERMTESGQYLRVIALTDKGNNRILKSEYYISKNQLIPMNFEDKNLLSDNDLVLPTQKNIEVLSYGKNRMLLKNNPYQTYEDCREDRNCSENDMNSKYQANIKDMILAFEERKFGWIEIGNFKPYYVIDYKDETTSGDRFVRTAYIKTKEQLFKPNEACVEKKEEFINLKQLETLNQQLINSTYDQLKNDTGDCIQKKKSKNVIFNSVNRHWESKQNNSNVIKFDGRIISHKQLKAIDFFARGLCGEMRSTHEEGPQYMQAVARILYNRAAFVAAGSTKQTQGFIYSNRRPIMRKSKDNIPLVLHHVFERHSQISAFDPKDINAEYILCPLNKNNKYKRVNPEDLRAWKMCLNVAAETVLYTKDFLEKTKDFADVYNYTSNGARINGVDKKVSIDTLSIEGRLFSGQALNIFKTEEPALIAFSEEHY